MRITMQPNKKDRVNRIEIEMIKSMMMTGRKRARARENRWLRDCYQWDLHQLSCKKLWWGSNATGGVSGAFLWSALSFGLGQIRSTTENGFNWKSLNRRKTNRERSRRREREERERGGTGARDSFRYPRQAERGTKGGAASKKTRR